MPQGLTPKKAAEGHYTLYTKTKVAVGWAEVREGEWSWGLTRNTRTARGESLADCVYQAEEALGIPHAIKEEKPGLKRVKVGDQSYEIRDRITGELKGYAARTGSHLDNYPWDWRTDVAKGLGVADSLAACIEKIEYITKRDEDSGS